MTQANTGVMPNEIRDYLRRAPKKWSFDGARMVNHSHARLVWLASMAQGTLDEKINRRAGIAEAWQPWHFPVDSARRRHNRRQLIIKFGRPGNTHFPQ